VATVRRLTERAAVRELLQPMRALAAYPLAYLDPFRFDHCQFYQAHSEGKQALLFHGWGGLGPSTQMIGDARLLAGLLRLHPGPRNTLITFEAEHQDVALLTHHLWRPQSMLRMRLDRAAFAPPPPAARVRRLVAGDAAELNRLYAMEGEGIWYSGRQIEEGLYYGALQRDRLIAAAGTHIHSVSQRVGVVGNVFTHPDFRGHGLGTAVTAAVSARLLEQADLVVLSVDPANRTARRVYERLGYVDAGRVIEAPATRRTPVSPLAAVFRAVARRRAASPGTEEIEI
jgi:RimJ/RimL family protein N-acetyltransferase